MRIVLDTNVLVSALLTPHGTCAQVVALVREGRVLPLLDDRVLAEYQEVLSRPKLAIAKEAVAELLSLIEEAGAVVVDPPAREGSVPDPDDRPFIEVALAGHAGAIVTGNRSHFPADLGVQVLSPAELLDRLGDK
jgi:putative PIN family toxin of toxin-antitoxin system